MHVEKISFQCIAYAQLLLFKFSNHLIYCYIIVFDSFGHNRSLDERGKIAASVQLKLCFLFIEEHHQQQIQLS